MEINLTTATGVLCQDDDFGNVFLRISGVGSLPVVLRPEWEDRIDWGKVYTVSGALASPFWAQYSDSCPSEQDTCLYVKQVEKLSEGKSKKPVGSLTIVPKRWIDGGERSLIIEGITCDKHRILIGMPAVHTRWAQHDPNYLIDQVVHLSVAVEEERVLIAKRVLSVTAKVEPEVKNLPPTPGSITWERPRQTVARRRRSGIGPKRRRQVFVRDGYRCQECGVHPDATNRHVFLEVDHIIPVSKGGGNEMENLQTLCSCCNAGKSDLMPSHLAA
jgi:hypothetical protein